MPSGKDLTQCYANSGSKRVYFRFGKTPIVTSTSTVTVLNSTLTSATVPLSDASSVSTSAASSVVTGIASSANSTIVVPSVVTSVVSSVSASVVPSVATRTVSSVSVSVVPSVATSTTSSVSAFVVPSVAISAASSVFTSVASSVATSVASSVSTVTVPSVATHTISTLTSGIQNAATSSKSCDEDWETVGTILADHSPVGLLDDGAGNDQELEQTGEQLLCERRLYVNDGSLPVFLNLTFEEMSFQAAQDRRVMVIAVLSTDGTICAHLARLLSGISNTRNTYFWVAEEGSKSGRLVKRKFGEQNKDAELFVLSPTTAILNPILVDCFSGDSLVETPVEAVKEAIERLGMQL